MNLVALSDFLNKSGMRKVGTGILLYGANAVLVSQKMLAGPEFVELSRWLILALFGGNAIEHWVKNQKSKETPDAPKPAA